MSAKKPHEDPTVLVADITAHLAPIKHEVARLDRKPKPRPPVVPKAAKNATAGNETAPEEPAASAGAGDEPPAAAGEDGGGGGAENGGEGEAAPEGEADRAEETKEEL